jgi:methylthioribose-1-phosphate isomerase
MRSIEWRDGDIVIIDQTALPARLEYLTLRDTEGIVDAISRLSVRGAPALGIIGAFGVAQAALRPPTSSAKTVVERAEHAATVLAATRPTAVNLAWGIDRVLAKGRAMPLTAGAIRIAQAMVDEARSIQNADAYACIEMAKHALGFFKPKGVVLTHCNTGFLCTGGYGTALGAIRYAHEAGLRVVVVATETRPLLQGARLTAWELTRLGIPHALVVDGAAPGLIARDEVSLVIVGADRIAANGDVANKVGTYPLALAAAAARVPFVVVAPTSTVDLSRKEGSTIPVEERDGTEVTSILGSLSIAPVGTQAINPAFDLTPASLITAIVTEHGIARAPFGPALKKMVGRGKKAVTTVVARETRKAAAQQKKAKPKRAPAAKKKKAPASKKPPAAKRRPAAKRAAKRSRAKKPTRRS